MERRKRWGGGGGKIGSDLSLSDDMDPDDSPHPAHISSLNITRRTGLGGTGSPHVQTQSQVAETCRDTLPSLI